MVRKHPKCGGMIMYNKKLRCSLCYLCGKEFHTPATLNVYAAVMPKKKTPRKPKLVSIRIKFKKRK